MDARAQVRFPRRDTKYAVVWKWNLVFVRPSFSITYQILQIARDIFFYCIYEATLFSSARCMRKLISLKRRIDGILQKRFDNLINFISNLFFRIVDI